MNTKTNILALMLLVVSSLELVIGIKLGKSFQKNDVPEIDSSLSEWQILELAIIKTESDFNPLARGTHNDLGIFQGTEIWVEDINRIVGDPKYLHFDCLDVDKSLEMFDIFQDYYNPQKDIGLAIAKHNPGGDAVGYSIGVRKNIEWIKRYEEIRRKIN